jgi:hypothetical protein
MQSDKKLRPVYWLDLTEGRRTLPREDALAKQLEVCIIAKKHSKFSLSGNIRDLLH